MVSDPFKYVRMVTVSVTNNKVLFALTFINVNIQAVLFMFESWVIATGDLNGFIKYGPDLLINLMVSYNENTTKLYFAYPPLPRLHKLV